MQRDALVPLDESWKPPDRRSVEIFFFARAPTLLDDRNSFVIAGLRSIDQTH